MWRRGASIRECRNGNVELPLRATSSLTLDNLPSTLIPRLDPREIAADATRLPEDVTSWPAWVDKEVR